MIKLNFETLTPLHISNGEQLAYNLQYIVTDDDYVAKLNFSKACEKLAEAKLFNFNKDYKFLEIIKIIEANKKIFTNDCFEYKIYAEGNFTNFIRNERRDGQKILQEFINSNGNFYIPGSSIKGMLTTILNRDPERNPLGINPKNPIVSDRFIITDSEYLDADDLVVDVANRPPSINLMTLDAGVPFSSKIKSKGNLDLRILRENLLTYSSKQMNKALHFIKKYKEMEKKPGGASSYLNFLENMLNNLVLDEHEYLINLGFGGGSYYKLFETASIPKFRNPGRKGKLEEAHTTFTLEIENEIYQLGWCKLKIEEE
jgi:CRISPR/Cas system CSM-associated protein Csm5 (group 7 of RAMP superfamily)